MELTGDQETMLLGDEDIFRSLSILLHIYKMEDIVLHYLRSKKLLQQMLE